MTDKTHWLEGLLAIRDRGESSDVLFCGDTVVAEWAGEDVGLDPGYGQPQRQQVSLRYWITDKAVTREEAQKQAVETLLGDGEAKFEARYSEITGYLWTDEEFTVGGHNMLERLSSDLGKYLHLELTVHGVEPEPPPP